jgi:hypothetical protein
MEMAAAARAQSSAGQEFANFSTKLGVGTYWGQLRPLELPKIDPDLNGFEGGYVRSTSYSVISLFNNVLLHSKTIQAVNCTGVTAFRASWVASGSSSTSVMNVTTVISGKVLRVNL